ncbi:hypothetical protein [Streptomyces longispororuber]|uniref:hypothetical protein n=1 Tax=Streptomyces longispororuber TaxID=68230 RepID=UPI00210DB260|nr:hypothetical protein [Streptomyces longispororuber]MCQ4211452.1 hypothetical protein [Streptomyces longispororuber]
MLTVLVVASLVRVPALIARIEELPDVSVLSHTHDSRLALARARLLMPDVLVVDLSAMFTPDAPTVLDQARRLQPSCTVVVHADEAVIGVIGPAGDVVPAASGRASGLAEVLAGLAQP